jgi:riboflavin kinase/FMN adenylyltransferase
MDVVRGIEALPLGRGPTAVTIGFFDGVHLGHRMVISRTVQIAGERGLHPVAVTFDRHPREVFAPGTQPKLLTTIERRASLIAELGVETLLVLAFTEDFSRWPPEAFVDRVLVEGLAAAEVVVGANFTFGYKAMGTVEVLQRLGEERGFPTEGVALVDLDGRRVSSTSVREALAAGDLTWPERALGRRFVLDGAVTTGAGRGRGLGYPTANLDVGPKLLLPGSGIYAGRALLFEGPRAAAISVGTNPTFGEEPLHTEAFLLEFDGDLRGRPMALEFWQRLRGEVRFDSAEDLARQIKEDVELTRRVVPLG